MTRNSCRACSQNRLELLGSQAAVAGHEFGGHWLDREVQVLAHSSAVRPPTWFTTSRQNFQDEAIQPGWGIAQE
jgi:hypothetical protein